MERLERYTTASDFFQADKTRTECIADAKSVQDELDALQAEGSVRSEKNLLKASGSFTKGAATKDASTKDASPSSETKTKRSNPSWNIR